MQKKETKLSKWIELKEDYSGGRKVEKNPDTMCIINVSVVFNDLVAFKWEKN